MRQFEQTLGVVENIDKTSRQLKEALESGKTIIVTTLQKFPVIAEADRRAAGQAFRRDRRRGPFLAVRREHQEPQGRARRQHARRGRGDRRPRRGRPKRSWRIRSWPRSRSAGGCPTSRPSPLPPRPSPRRLNCSAPRRADGKFEPFRLYSMRQAIEEGFILDVLANYTTYTAYWRLLEEDRGRPALRQEARPSTCSSPSSSCTRTPSTKRCGSWSSISRRRRKARSAARPKP